MVQGVGAHPLIVVGISDMIIKDKAAIKELTLVLNGAHEK